jgi:molybdopterin converting factor small subunit
MGQSVDIQKVRALFFGPLRDIVGSDELILDSGEAVTGQTAFESLAKRFPALRPWRQSLRLAINRQYAPFEQNLDPGDEICFIPPVSGG